MGTIFISHAEEDSPLAREIAKGLEDSGYNTWYYERDTLPGASYLIQITRAIECCDALILLATPRALDSDQVTREVVGAFERSVPFFPVLVNVTSAELKERQPEWRHALGGAAMICAEGESLSSTIPRIVDGLRALGIASGGRGTSTTAPTTQAPPHLTESILSSRPSLEGERKQVTVLFGGVSVLASLSESMDPEEIHDLISPAIEIMAEEVHRYEGTVAQLSGEGIMALFGAPLAHEDAPHRALYAALAMRRRLREYGEKLKPRGIDLQLRIGANTGLVIVGRIGDDLAMEYTAIGDTVNLASGMRSAAEPGTIMAAENTWRLTEGYFDFSESGEISAEGKEEPVQAWRVLGARPARSSLDASQARGLSPFVGRERELQHLLTCFRQARDGSGQVVGVVGEPGVGKSRLILHFRELLPEGEYTYLEGGCIHYGEAIAYLPILGILRSYFGVSEGEEEDTIKRRVAERISSLDGHLEDIIPPLQELLSLSVEDEEYLALEPRLRREMIFEAVRYVFLAESQVGPLVLTVEDLHWIDRTSEEFLSYFIESLPGAPILLILLYRPEYAASWVSKTYYRQILVDQLSERSSNHLVKSILTDGKVAPELSDFIVNRAAGNPLFIEELTRGLLEAGSILKDNGRYVLSADPSDMRLPETIQGIIASRLDRLPEELKEVVQVASVIGREFSLRLLEAVTGMGKVLKSHLHALQALEFIYEKSLFPEAEYFFKHALTQEVAYDGILLKRRKELHERIGRAIEDIYPDRLEEFYETLAHHYSCSDNAEAALRYLELYGAKAASKYSLWESIRFYREAIRLLDTQPETEERKRKKLETYLAIMGSLLLFSWPEGSLDVLQEAQRLAEELGDDRSKAAVYGRLGHYHSDKGNAALGMEYAEKCLDAAEKAGDVEWMAEISLSVFSSELMTGRLAEIADISSRVLQLLQERHRERDLLLGGLTAYSFQSAYRGAALGMIGKFDEAEDAFEAGLVHAIEAGDTWGKGFVETLYSVTFVMKGDGEGAVARARDAIVCFGETGIERLQGMALGFIGYGNWLLGRYEEARECAEKSLESSERAGTIFILPWNHILLAWALSGAGDLEGARRSARAGLQLALDSKARLWEAFALIAHGRVAGEADPARVEDAERDIRQAISLAEEMKAKAICAQGYLFLGEVFELAGRGEEALENLSKAEEMYREMEVGPRSGWLARCREALARLGN